MPVPSVHDLLLSDAADWTFAGIGVLLLLSLAREIPRIPSRLLVLMAAAFLDMVGVLMIVPLAPFYVLRLGRGGVDVGVFHLAESDLVGLLAGMFTLAQLISAPMWGRFSDRHGRRPTLLVALLASAVSYVVFGFADSLWLLFLSRLVQGIGGGTVGVIQAYVADSVEPAQRARALGWLSAATNLGVALGPVIGSKAVALGGERYGHIAPGLLAAAMCLLTMLFAFCFLRESNAERAPAHAARPPIRDAVGRVLLHPGEPPSRLILIYALAMGANMGATSMLALLLARKFGIDEHSIGRVFLWIGAVSVLARVLLLGPLVDRLGEARLSRIGIVFLAAGLASLPFTVGLSSLALAVAMLPLGMSFTFPCVTGLLSRVVDQRERGMFMGLQQTFGGSARFVMPMLCGYLFARVTPGTPFLLGSVLVLSTLLLTVGLGRVAARPTAKP